MSDKFLKWDANVTFSSSIESESDTSNTCANNEANVSVPTAVLRQWYVKPYWVERRN